MANGIKIGSLNIDSLKVGSGDCTVYLGDTLLYSGGTPPAPHDYSQDYLTFRALEDGTFKFSGNSINYSLDSGTTWTELASDTDTPTVNSGDTILWKASLTAGSNGIGRFSSTGQFEVEGNVMSLKFGDNFSSQTTLSDSYSFYCLFYQCSGVTSAENTVLPATALSTRCYASMFQGCTSLTTAPELSATTLSTSCYASMFWHCTNLTTAPTLPATTLANYCYSQMFQGCTNLTTAPELSATALTSGCYNCMFINCTSLTTAPSVLPATTLVSSCYMQMFQGCTSLTTAPELSATTLAVYCYNSMFRGCTNLTTAPTLSATTLTNYCYQNMFSGCSSLSSITCLATDISASGCISTWVADVAATGTFTTPSSTSWTTGNNGIPNGWTRVDYSS